MRDDRESPRLRQAGDSAMLLELAARIDPELNARAIGIAAAVRAASIPGVRDIIPTYRSVAVSFDPLVTDPDAVAGALRLASDSTSSRDEGTLVEVPVVYGGAEGPDLEDVSRWAGLSQDEVIARHVAPIYRVFMLGFIPGFAYLGTVDPSIAAPRRAVPRKHVPVGSVGIAGGQAGVYPRGSPGGWQLLGRTALALFDPRRTPAALLAPGDRVRFTVQARDEARPFQDEPATGSRPRSGDTSAARGVTVVRAGLLTTVQDAGRWGHQDRGVPVAGPMDLVAHRLANIAVGNEPSLATLETTLAGPELRLEADATIAVAGADLGASVDGDPLPLQTARRCGAASVIRFGERRSGTRAYLAADGGFAVPLVLGSRATHVLSGLGGMDGRALRDGDWLPLGTASIAVPGNGAVSIPTVPVTVTAGGARLRVIRGPQDDYFDTSAFDLLQRTRFRITPQSNRMGYRLAGASLPRRAAEMISDASFPGGIQIPPSGEPILLMADRQTTGGYPQIATVITADLSIAGQLAPGDWIEFEMCSRDNAVAALRDQERVLARV